MIRDITATLVEKKNLAGNTWWLLFKVEGEPLVFAPGQYVILKIGTAYRQYSICSDPIDGTHFELLVEFFPGGLASTYFSELEVGGTAEFKGPAGVFTLKNTSDPKIYLVTGTGVAPVKAMIEHALSQGIGTQHELYFGLKTRSEAYFVKEFEELEQKYPNFSFQICLTREESDLSTLPHCRSGRITHVLDADLAQSQDDPNSFEFYVCGSKEIVASVKEHCVSRGIDPKRLHSEMFG